MRGIRQWWAAKVLSETVHWFTPPLFSLSLPQTWFSAQMRWMWTSLSWLTHCLRGPRTPAGWLSSSPSQPHTIWWSMAMRSELNNCSLTLLKKHFWWITKLVMVSGLWNDNIMYFDVMLLLCCLVGSHWVSCHFKHRWFLCFVMIPFCILCKNRSECWPNSNPLSFPKPNQGVSWPKPKQTATEIL